MQNCGIMREDKCESKLKQKIFLLSVVIISQLYHDVMIQMPQILPQKYQLTIVLSEVCQPLQGVC